LTNQPRDEDFETLLSYIKRNRGFDFTGYKRPSLMRRVRRRMESVHVETFGEYLDYLQAHEDEFNELFNTILINVTAFFRDAASWAYIAEQIVPKIVEGKPRGSQIRVWSTGCASGEEAYTIAMVFGEALGERVLSERVKIYATDIDIEALAQGRHGVYTLRDVEPLPAELREKYFERQDSRFAFRRDLRRSVIFGRHNLMEDPPISHIDFLVARNTLMYLSPEKQGGILAKFHFALNDGGFLFLGKSELMLTRSNLFVPVDLKRRVFAPLPPSEPVQVLQRAASHSTGGQRQKESLDDTIGDAGFESAPLAQMIIDTDGALVVANLQARRLFGIDHGDIGAPFSDLDVSFRPAELRSRIEESRQEARIIHLRDVEWRRNDDLKYMEVQIAPVAGRSGDTLGTSITFTDVTRFKELTDTLENTNHELETAYEELQATTEELETTNEELQSTNEELETTNEELQSTNEELETMNEELQSTNEEMETMNDEFGSRTAELAEKNSFLVSVLTSLHSAVAVVDRDLSVLVWNEAATELWGLREDEVRGEHFLNLDIGLPVEQLSKPIRACAETGDRQEVTIEATNRRGRRITCAITFNPLRYRADEVDGVILVMDATEQ
jgi:two-component system, chemotaxis family, CheB/CheR fusion protein